MPLLLQEESVVYLCGLQVEPPPGRLFGGEEGFGLGQFGAVGVDAVAVF
jgi:hypothetical protein